MRDGELEPPMTIAAVTGVAAPLVSVGLPTFNRGSSLARAIESVLAQDFGDLELVISDNASTDATQSLCASFAARDPRIRYSRQAENQGASANFQAVLTKSRGPYFMWLSDDDWLDPTYISSCLRVLRTHEDIALVCGTTQYVDEHGPVHKGVVVNLIQSSPAERVLSYYRQVNDNGTFYGIARRELLLQHPMQNVLGGDWMLLATLALTGKIQTLPDVHIHRSSVGASANVSQLARHYGLSERAARLPHRTIAINVARDIVRQSAHSKKIGWVASRVLAARCAWVVNRRFVETDLGVARLVTRIRQRLGKMMRPAGAR